MRKYKVKRTSYKQLTQDQLLVYAQNVVKQTFEVETYLKLAPEVAALREKTVAYDEALVANQDGGRPTTITKNLFKTEVVEGLDDVADSMDYFGGKDLSFFVNGGMDVQGVSRKKSFEKQLPEIPINPIVKPTTVRGCIAVEVEVVNPQHVISIAAEWSDDGGATWNNGNYFTPSKSKTKSTAKGKMKNLTSFKEVMVRFRAIGKHDMKSEWTNILTVPVL